MKDFLRRLNETEPARVRAVWTAIVALLVGVGVVVSTDLDTMVNSVIVIVFTVLPLLQGEATRAKVFAPATVEQLVAESSDTFDGEASVPAVEYSDEDAVDEPADDYGDDDPPGVESPYPGPESQNRG